ncbi:hypothetical protein [Actinomadura xylanilytica]|uniref:hypothetical protein n=1 Tax=Actinomadura xylanilytica TaxID=887459 RepID=UPI00255A8B76|nr:hypothetical protein [Actinomadura xylanilytica]MDL4775773.1 hypothetical protein [Actinomadura xylanilytica]
MDPLAIAAGTALVTAIATDGWEQARNGAVALWQRVHPGRAQAIEEELDDLHERLLLARRANDRDAEAELLAEWRLRLARLLADDPSIEVEVSRVLDQVWRPLLPDSQQARTQALQRGEASGHGRVYQAGRDMTIGEKPAD